MHWQYIIHEGIYHLLQLFHPMNHNHALLFHYYQLQCVHITDNARMPVVTLTFVAEGLKGEM